MFVYSMKVLIQYKQQCKFLNATVQLTFCASEEPTRTPYSTRFDYFLYLATLNYKFF